MIIIKLATLLILIAGCSAAENPSSGLTISATQELVLNEKDLEQLGMISNETDCQTEEYETNEYSPLAQYSICYYTINSFNDTQAVLELQKFANLMDLNGTYQYSSLHLRGFQGLISENEHGDLSRFYVNNESTVYYYHLWIIKNEYLIHITSKGSKDAQDYITKIGRVILAKFNEP